MYIHQQKYNKSVSMKTKIVYTHYTFIYKYIYVYIDSVDLAQDERFAERQDSCLLVCRPFFLQNFK